MSERDTIELAELKKSLEEKISKLEKELALCKLNIKLIDEALAKVSFKPASKLIETRAMEELKLPQEVPAPQEASAQQPQPAPAVPQREVAPPPPAGDSASEAVGERPFFIRSKTGEELGTIFVSRSLVRIVPRADLHLNVRTPPFQTFFVDRVLGEMRRKDEMAADAGSKDPMSIIEHKIVLDGETIKEIRIENLDDESRLREIKSSIRWTFERMLEKAKG
ncbi:MAG: hypothetical protein QFX35_02100 [Candidatus Verstraetearchaeota archaeon]|nr:hypothetical protein [Candidatus Verstraetearchaeota archaeon]